MPGGSFPPPPLPALIPFCSEQDTWKTYDYSCTTYYKSAMVGCFCLDTVVSTIDEHGFLQGTKKVASEYGEICGPFLADYIKANVVKTFAVSCFPLSTLLAVPCFLNVAPYLGLVSTAVHRLYTVFCTIFSAVLGRYHCMNFLKRLCHHHRGTYSTRKKTNDLCSLLSLGLLL